MTDANRDPQHKTEAIKEHERVDAETVLEDVKELFEPDNTEIPPPNPDQPPPAD